MISPVLIQDLPININPKTSKAETVDENFIFSLFQDIDELPTKVNIQIQAYFDGTPYAYAIVQFESSDQASKAISEINYIKVDGKPIRLKLWNLQAKNILLESKGRIIIKNLSQDIDLIKLSCIMSEYGDVIDCEIPTRNGKSFSYGIVQFNDPKDAQKAVQELNGKYFNEQKVELFEMDEKKIKKTNDINKNYQELIIFSGLNDFSQLHYKSTQNNSEDQFIISPPIVYPLRNISVSYSIYYRHKVSILHNGKAVGIGDNSFFQINFSKSKKFEYKSEFSIRASKTQLFESFKSAVCGTNYTLFLCNPDKETDHPFLALNGFNLNKGMATVFDRKSGFPVSLYGGEKTSAAIDSNGSAIIIASESIFVAHLPEKKKAVLLACLNEKVIALSSDGHLYEVTIDNMKKEEDKDNIEFKIIDEISEIKFLFVSGSSNHCLAVAISGTVYARGDNTYGQLGVDSDTQYISEFVKVKKLTKNKILSAFAGFDHSLFLDERGAVFACGSNKNGQLMTDLESSEELYRKPIKTVIESGATFGIAGKGISVVFLYAEPPENCPNMKIKGTSGDEDYESEDANKQSENDEEEKEEIVSNNEIEAENENHEFCEKNQKRKSESDRAVINFNGVQEVIDKIMKSLELEKQIFSELIEQNKSTERIIDEMSERLDKLLYDNSTSNSASDHDESEEKFNPNINNSRLAILDSIQKLSFSDGRTSLSDLENSVWDLGVTKMVEFFKDEFTPVTVVDINNTSHLIQSLNSLDDGLPISCNFKYYYEFWKSPISLFVFCGTGGVVIVVNDENIVNNGPTFNKPSDFKNACPNGISVMAKFLSSHSLFGKGISQQQIKLKQIFGIWYNIEDLEKTRLVPRNMTLNFLGLVALVHGNPCTEFVPKRFDPTIRWDQRPLNTKMALAAAFKAFGVRLIWKYFVTTFKDDEVISFDSKNSVIDNYQKRKYYQKTNNKTPRI